MKKEITFFIGLCIGSHLLAQDLSLENLRCNSRINPPGVEDAAPRFNWELRGTGNNILQTAWRILVADDWQKLQKNEGNIWDSHKVSSSASIQIPYAGKPLQSAKTYFWKVMAWDNQGHASGWSEPANWQMGLLQPGDWKGAAWIAYDRLPDSAKIIPAEHGNGKREWGKRSNVLPLLRRSFSIHKNIKKATAFISGLGQFELHINGKKAGDHFLDPGWTRYDHSALYVSLDITSQVQRGENAIGVMLGNGLYYLPGERYRKMTGAYDQPKMICRIMIEFDDGTVQDIVSNTDWMVTASPVIFSSMYGGEDYDATKEQIGWDEPGFNATSWRKAIVTSPHKLRSQVAEPVRVMQEFIPQTSNTPRKGLMVYDMGQNMSGIPAITVKGNRGDTIRITPAELLNADGTANQKPTGSPSYFQYILKGEGEESWQPRFTYYGFRYLQLESLRTGSSKDHPQVLSVKGLHTRNSMPVAGSFRCSNELFNKTFDLILWAINSNTQSIFTDCPHRERLGWQEQVHLVGNSIQYNYALLPLASKILEDIREAQTPDGLVPSTVPEFTEMHFANGYFRDSPEWGSTAILFPWYLYHWYGDDKVLSGNYDIMRRYIRYLESRDSSDLLVYGLNDWYDLGPQRPGFCQLTPMGVTATAYYFYNLQVMEKIATLLAKKKDAAYYRSRAAIVKAAFTRAFYDPVKRQVATGSQTANAIAVYMNLVPAADKKIVVQHIVDDIQARGNSLTSGDIGFRYLLQVLDDAGRSDVIYAMNSRSDVPGYGYQLAKGATALTESWQAFPNVSNNHLMLGHLMEWFYEGLAGIRQAKGSIGYKEVEIRPQVAGDVTAAAGTFQSPYGKIAVQWKLEGDIFSMEVTIPANSTARIFLPGSSEPVLRGSGTYTFTKKLK